MDKEEFIYGRNSVIEYLSTDKDVNKAFIQKGNSTGSINKIVAILKEKKIPISVVDKNKLNNIVGNSNHQGVALGISNYRYAEVEDIIKKAEKNGEDPFILILDSIQDPHNLGAIIRTANQVGAHGIIIPKRRSAQVTGVVGKVSAGAINYTLVARVNNLNDTIKKLKDRGIWVMAADMNGHDMYSVNLRGALAIVIGNEGEGVSQLVKKNSDLTIKIPMVGDIDSLNASVSAAVISYEAFRQRKYGRS